MIDALTDVEDIAFSAETPNQPFQSSGNRLQDMLNKQIIKPIEYWDETMGDTW